MKFFDNEGAKSTLAATSMMASWFTLVCSLSAINGSNTALCLGLAALSVAVSLISYNTLRDSRPTVRGS